MANEAEYTYATQVTAVSGTATLAANGFNGSAEVTALTSTNHSNYPLADAALYASFSASVSSASNYINLYRRDINIDGTNDAPQPQSAAPAYSAKYVGAFQIPPYTATSSGYFSLPDIPLTAECEFYLENKTDSAIATAFTLKITPKTYAPGA